MFRFSRGEQIGEAEFNTERKTIVTSAHLENKISQRFAVNWMQGMQKQNREKGRNLDEVFF